MCAKIVRLPAAGGEGREAEMKSIQGLWDPIGVEPERCCKSRIGGLTIWLKHDQGDWYVATERAGDNATSAPFKPVRTEPDTLNPIWNRWAGGSESLTAQMLPIMPDHPVVVRPEQPLKFPAGHKALLYVSVPVWVQVSVGTDPAVVLCEIPSLVLSKTWFGDTASGDLCYSLKTRARRHAETSGSISFRALCAVNVENGSGAELSFERFCLHVDNLAVYASAEQLWTSKVNVVYRGQDQLSQIDVSASPSGQPEQCRLLCRPRVPAHAGLFKRSFHVLKMLAGL